MQFKEGASVYTPENEKVGDISRVVIDPATKEVTHIVVQKGFLFTEDKVVPMSLVGPATEERVTLRMDEGEFDDLPNFSETHYLNVDSRIRSGEEVGGRIYPTYYYPPVGAWWRGPLGMYSMPVYIKRTEKNIPEGTVAIEEGADVIGSDGEQLGDIERIFTDPQSDRATHILISEGLIFKDKKLVPTNWISTIQNKKIFLSVDSELVEDLPEYSS